MAIKDHEKYCPICKTNLYGTQFIVTGTMAYQGRTTVLTDHGRWISLEDCKALVEEARNQREPLTE